jgi:hypothetical protein
MSEHAEDDLTLRLKLIQVRSRSDPEADDIDSQH